MSHRLAMAGAWLLAAAVLQGCAQAPVIPQGYVGPIATVRDSMSHEGGGRALFFYVAKIDGRDVKNALGESRALSQGRGNYLVSVDFSREVTARPIVIALEARVAYGAPIVEMVKSSTVYTASARVAFTPDANKAYVVKGVLTQDRQAVWLEDADTNQPVPVTVEASK